MSKWSENLAKAKEYAALAHLAEQEKEWETAAEAWDEAYNLALGFDERDVYWLRFLAAQKKLADAEEAKQAKIWRGC